MLKLDYFSDGEQRQLGLDFNYVTEDGQQQPSITVADLYNVDTDEVVARGVAMRHRNDNFSRVTGRKIAFRRAVEEFTDSYSVRAQLWTSYLAQVKV